MNMVLGDAPANEPISDEDRMLFRCILQKAVGMAQRHSDGTMDLQGGWGEW